MKTLSTLLLLCVCLVSGAVHAQRAAGAPLPRDSVYQLDVTLTTHEGRRQPWSSHRGKPQLVSMFYTSCQYICPLIVDAGKAVERELGPNQRKRLGIVLISMDPETDTPAALRSVVEKRRLDPTRWTLASPERAQVRAVAGVLGIRYRELADGEFNHTSALVLLDSQGRVLARTERMGSQPDPEFLAAVRTALGPE